MRALSRALLFILALTAACAFPRHATPLNPVPAERTPRGTGPAGLYAFRLVSAEVPGKTISGLPWDDDGSGPDPFVRLYVDEQLMFESAPFENVVQPRWDIELPRNLVIPSTSVVRVELWDRDSAVSADPIGRWTRRGVPTSVTHPVAARVMLTGGAVVSMTFGAPRAHQGLGLSVELRDASLRVLEVEPYSPAARAGLHPGDRILAIAGESVDKLGAEPALGRLVLSVDRGEPIRVSSDGDNSREVTLDRGYVWLVM